MGFHDCEWPRGRPMKRSWLQIVVASKEKEDDPLEFIKVLKNSILLTQRDDTKHFTIARLVYFYVPPAHEVVELQGRRLESVNALNVHPLSAFETSPAW